jgi:adenosylmethionine-8-amino-7-oxononanoate aminotransferase
MITFAKGVTSGYAPLGGVIVRDHLAEPFRAGTASFLHGITFGGHPVSCAVALANLDVMAKEDLPGRVRHYESDFRSMLESLTDLPLVAEVRGTGYFYAIELTNEGKAFGAAECEWLIRKFLSHRLLELGLICRTDDRGDPVVQFSPPLVAGPDEFDFIGATLRQVLVEAWKELEAGAAR